MSSTGSAWVDTVEKAVAAERERCARIAESFVKDYPSEVRHMAQRIAEVIRRQPRPYT